MSEYTVVLLNICQSWEQHKWSITLVKSSFIVSHSLIIFYIAQTYYLFGCLPHNQSYRLVHIGWIRTIELPDFLQVLYR